MEDDPAATRLVSSAKLKLWPSRRVRGSLYVKHGFPRAVISLRKIIPYDNNEAVSVCSSMSTNSPERDADISSHIWIGTIVTLVPATFAVVLRFIARYVASAGLWWDDFTIIISLVP